MKFAQLMKLLENYNHELQDLYNSDLNPSYYKDENVSYRFHTSLETQEILSNKWYDYLKNKLI
jgi:hypothetical protein